MEKKKIVYIAVTTICIIAIVLVIVAMMQKGAKPSQNTTNTMEGKTDAEEIKEEFEALFNNELQIGNYDTSNITLVAADKPLVYTAYHLTDKREGKYDINIDIPILNVSNPVADEINRNTQDVFAEKANNIMLGSNANTIYTIDYQAFINQDMVSIIIRATLKEGDNPQRVIIQTYNYNFVTQQLVTIDEVLQIKGIQYIDAENKIKRNIEEANRQAESLKNLGYEVYSRNVNDERYLLNKTTNFLVANNYRVYAIYAYGNNNYTSEYDLVAF